MLFESTNAWAFNEDSKDLVAMAEAATLDLEQAPEEDLAGIHGRMDGWRALGVRPLHSPESIITRRAKLGC